MAQTSTSQQVVNDTTDFLGNLGASFQNTLDVIASYLPKIASALVIFIIGWIIARVIRWTLTKVFDKVGFNRLADKVGINSFLAKGGMKRNASNLLAQLGYWMVMLLTLTTTFDALGLDAVNNLIESVFNYIPNIFMACFILVVGMYLAEFVSGLVAGTLKGGNFENADFVARIAYYAIAFFTVSIALTEVGIGDGIIKNVVSIFVGGLGLAFSLAFGLGAKDWAKDLVEKNLKF